MRSRQNLLEHHPEREQIAAPVDTLASKLLGRHVARRSRDTPAAAQTFDRFRLAVRRRHLHLRCQPEVHHLHVAVPAQHYVRRLQITMDDPVLVCFR